MASGRDTEIPVSSESRESAAAVLKRYTASRLQGRADRRSVAAANRTGVRQNGELLMESSSPRNRRVGKRFRLQLSRILAKLLTMSARISGWILRRKDMAIIDRFGRLAERRVHSCAMICADSKNRSTRRSRDGRRLQR